MMSTKKLTIKMRLWGGMGAMVAIIALCSASAHWLITGLSRQTVTMVESNVAERVAAEAARAAVGAARKSDLDFLLNPRAEAVSDFDKDVAEIKAQFQRVETVTNDPARRKAAEAANGQVEAFQQAFYVVRDLVMTQGGSHDAGEQGDLRKAAHAVETAVNDQGSAELAVLFLQVRRHEKDFMLREDAKYVGEVTKRIAEFEERMVSLGMTSELQTKFKGLWKTYSDAFTSYVADAEAIKNKTQEMREQAQKLDDQAAEVATAAEKDIETAVHSLMGALTSTMWLIYVLYSVVGIGLLIAFVVTRAVTRPIGDIMGGIKEMAAGNLTVQVPVQSQDEIGQIATSVNTLAQTLHDSLVEVTRASEQVAGAAQQLSSASEELSTGAQQQASSLEETAASLEEISETIKQNAESAQQASQLAVSSVDVAERGRQVVTTAVGAMNEINQSSRKIADIITVIDEIAFQTNLLALNAAVEAARAGEQGRGFAVVAAEVRNLAQRSATAAKEIKGLIHDSTQKVQDGSTLVTKSGQSLEEIVGSVKRVTDIVGEITAASREQANGIDQVNKAVSQMDQVVQTNSAQTEEMSSTAQGLTQQAEQLQMLVSRFKLNQNGQQQRSGQVAQPVVRVAVAKPRASTKGYVNGHARGQAGGFEEF